MNLRQTNRYLLTCPANYRWLSPDGLEQIGTGTTRDLGVRGVFVRSDRIPAVGTQIDISIALPNCEDTRYGMRLRGMGKVLRIEQKSDVRPAGFAVFVNLDVSPP